MSREIFTVRVVTQWNRLPRAVVDAPSLEVLKARLAEALSNLVEGVPAHSRGVGTRWSLRSLPTQTILWFYELSGKTYTWKVIRPKRFVCRRLQHCCTHSFPFLVPPPSLNFISTYAYMMHIIPFFLISCTICHYSFHYQDLLHRFYWSMTHSTASPTPLSPGPSSPPAGSPQRGAPHPAALPPTHSLARQAAHVHPRLPQPVATPYCFGTSAPFSLYALVTPTQQWGHNTIKVW